MSDSQKFHDFAFKSTLFKGRGEWYFCYLKSEKIAHVLATLAQMGAAREPMRHVVERSKTLPGSVAALAAGELSLEAALADVFALLSSLRLLQTDGVLSKSNVDIISREYEQLAERLMRGSNPSPFLSVEDFGLPALSMQTLAPQTQKVILKDTQIHKGHTNMSDSKASDRSSQILEIIKQNKGISIKDISAVVRGCSEKTIQRELLVLIEKGLVRREGQRRWSVYLYNE